MIESRIKATKKRKKNDAPEFFILSSKRPKAIERLSWVITDFTEWETSVKNNCQEKEVGKEEVCRERRKGENKWGMGKW